MGKLYRKKNGFVEKTVGDEMVIVPLVDQVALMEKVFSLNEIGSIVYNALSQPKSLDQLLELILCEFEIDRETAHSDLEQFLIKAVDKGIIQEL
ncbi:PqqD family protein [Carboxylicivirga sediminis]|uniref:PqqD family protein n=1 Tax=Carboxylicivirga sediminis TaxID=2006564 RepID=A0A941F4K8_9BACT|nr:PqqD family protein [Carboxylicivirga sediminis]MBR8536297.1 PqqD family protein [Carboxylicivirga sediminis]